FDVPVIGLPTIEHMTKAQATALVVDAGRTLLFDRTKLIELADAAGIAIQAVPLAASTAEPKETAAGMNSEWRRQRKRARYVSPLSGPVNSGGITRAFTVKFRTPNWSASSTQTPSALKPPLP